ncbi:MAG: GGDEF-domain containing protein, partial [Alphaproteobacteria bacterium]
MVSMLPTSNSESDGRIRLLRLQAVDQLVPAMMIANVICSGGLTLLLFESQPLALTVWFCLITSASSWRVIQAWVLRPTPNRRTASTRAMGRSVRQAFAMAVCFMSVPTWLLTQTSGSTFATIICLITGLLWAGGLALATVPAAAITYVGVVGTLTCSSLLIKGTSRFDVFICFLFLIGGATVIRSVLRQSRLFGDSQLQRIDLETQGQLIGVLLKDYEEQASDWLWETDPNLRYRNVSDRFAEALGRPREEIEGRAFGDLLVSAVPGNVDARGAIR